VDFDFDESISTTDGLTDRQLMSDRSRSNSFTLPGMDSGIYKWFGTFLCFLDQKFSSVSKFIELFPTKIHFFSTKSSVQSGFSTKSSVQSELVRG